MKVLLTGAQGYLGSVLGPYLMEQGFNVVGLDTGFYRAGWFYNTDVKVFPACRNKDVREVSEAELTSFDAVIHLAELSNDPMGEVNPELTMQINFTGTIDFARKCKTAGVKRFIQASSCSVYGGSLGAVQTEEAALNPLTSYARCKVLVEQQLSTLANDAFSPTFLRCATIYGPSPRIRFDLLLNHLAGTAFTLGEIKVDSDGTQMRPMVHILDVCQAMACTLKAERQVVHNQVINVGDNKGNYSLKDLSELVATEFTGTQVTFNKEKRDESGYQVNFDKIARMLPAFQCRYTAREGAAQLHQIFSRIHLTSEQFNSTLFNRLQHIQYLLDTKQIKEDLYWQ